MKKILLIMTMTIGSIALAQEPEANTIELEITNIGSDDGKMMVGLYGSESHWLKKTVMSQMVPIKNGKCKVIFENVPDGTFAISSYHDKNNNGNLDTNFLGIPKESTGSSNNAPARFGPPKWEEAKFRIAGESIKQTIKL